MSNQLLQNHPCYRDFPIRGLPILKDIIRNSSLKNKIIGTFSIFALLLPFFTALLIIFLVIFIKPENFSYSQLIPLWPLFLAALISLLLVIGGIIILLDTPRREQKRYYRIANITRLSEEKRCALALDGAQTFHCGFWSETLEYYPLQARLNDHEKPFQFLEPASTNPYIKRLIEDWGITNSQDYQRTLNQLIAGMHSLPFAEALLNDTNDNLKQRLSDLTLLPVDYIASCQHTTADGFPPRLIWGFDLWRAINLARTAFAAGYINEQKAWNDILTTADLAYEIFTGFDYFYNNYRLGNAFWSRNEEVTKNRREQQEFFKQHCNWPIRAIKWPSFGKVELNDNIKHGFLNTIKRF